MNDIVEIDEVKPDEIEPAEPVVQDRWRIDC